MKPDVIAQRLKAEAYAQGFSAAGIAALGPVETADAYDRWLERGQHGQMEYMARNREIRHDSRLPEPGMRSALVVALDYGGREPAGPVARYARGDDYHELMRDRLRAVHARLNEWLAREVHGRAYVDTGPLLERDLARRAGLGWFGKNANLISPERGSFFFIGSLVLDLELPADQPFESDHCGTCTRCLEACPTQAIVEPGVIDANRCISYLTIELREGIPEEMRNGIGELLYGCDVCQEVCPWNVRFARELSEPAFAPRASIAGKDARTLASDILAMSQDDYVTAFRRSPMKRAKLGGLKRNAAVVLDNLRTREAREGGQ
ncbi:MAG TPA: tRNA epoxyqueuosine(34) reductase QueG [Gemmatimonadaceae bacterium]|nr:tRNA epoxyqueuosine(34) reductase QueG [Gemmatimonadaceae bacterium]